MKKYSKDAGTEVSGADDKFRPFDLAAHKGRREFLKIGIVASAGVIAATAIYPLIELVRRKTPPKPVVFVDAVLLTEMPESGVKKAELSLIPGAKPDARVFIKRTPDGKLTAFSAVCTHLGCIVNYDRLHDEFICPCHGGKYDGNGKNIEGPPPEPLKKLPVRVAGEYIQVGVKSN